MNIFVLDKSPIIAADMLCDKHVPKMFLESCQLLCNVFDEAPYRRTHYNHPCSIWTRTSRDNFIWLLMHTGGIAQNYTERFGKVHKSEAVLNWCTDNMYRLSFDVLERTEFVQAMPDQYKVPGDPVQAYRNYYIGDKARFAKWQKLNNTPEWWCVAQ